MAWNLTEGEPMPWAVVSRMYNNVSGEQRVTKVCEVPGGVIYKFIRKAQNGSVSEAAAFVPLTKKQK